MAMNVSWGALVDGTANVSLNTPQNESGSVKTDASGNVYLLHYTQGSGTIRIMNADGTQHASYTATATNTGLIIKRNSAGAVQWYVRIENVSWFTPTCLDVDSNGNVYTAGYYDGTGNFTFRSTDATTATITKTYSLFTAYFAKYNSSGVVQWAFRPFLYTANGPSTLQNLVIDSSNNVYIAGSAPGNGYTVTSYDIASADGSKWRTSVPRGAQWQDAWLIKYNSSGIAQWGVRCATSLEARATAVALTPDGTSVLVAGVLHASGTYNVNRVNGTNDTSSTTVIATAGADGFVVSYSSAGQVNWAAAVTGAATDIGANQAEFPVSLAVSASSVYFGMRTMSSSLVVKGTTVSGFAQYTGVVIKMNVSDGAYVWSTKIIPTSPGASSYAYLTSIALDSNENLYVGGLQTAATATITDTGNATKSLSRIGTAGDGMVVKFNSSGVYQLVNKITNINMTDFWKDSPEVAVDKDNNVIFNGSSYGSSGATIQVYNSDETTVGKTFTRAATGWTSFDVKLAVPITVPATPAAPTISSVGDQQVAIAWVAPNNGGSAITGYTITIYNETASTSSTTSAAAGDTSKTISGLINGNTYTFTLIATNAIGNSTESSKSASAVPATTPSKPATPTLSAIGNQTVTVNWIAPSNGGSAITGYTITIYNITTSTSTTTSAAAGAISKVISGLTNGSSYKFTIIATNAIGNSTESDQSATAIPFTVPGAPSNVSAVPESLRALVSWTIPANNGSPITSFTIKARINGLPVVTREIAGEDITSGYIYELTNDIAYTFTVAATNAAGTSADSSPSSAVTPIADVPTTVVEDAIATGSPIPIQNYIADAPTSTPEQQADVTIDMRVSIQAATINGTTEEKVGTKLAFIDSMRDKLGSDTYEVPQSKFTEFVQTLMTTVSEPLAPKPIEVFVPAYNPSTTTATVNVSSTPTTSYLHVEVPIGYSIILQNGASSITLTFNGTSFSDGTNTYTTGSSIVLGDKTFTFVGIGSGTMDQQQTSEVICLTPGSEVLTPSGTIAVENLRRGDKVMTSDTRSIPISRIYKVVVAHATHVNAPYIIEKNAFGIGSPPKQLEVSPRHAIQIKPDLWELPCEAAKCNPRVYQNTSLIGKKVVYYHFALHDYKADNVIVNGQFVETMNDGKYLESYVWNTEQGGYIRTCKELEKKHLFF
jgi:hypothetical protein